MLFLKSIVNRNTVAWLSLVAVGACCVCPGPEEGFCPGRRRRETGSHYD